MEQADMTDNATSSALRRVLSSELAESAGCTVRVSGWLHKKRELGAITFAILRDRHGLMQVVLQDRDHMENLRSAHTGSILTVIGEVTAEPRAIGGTELHARKLTVDVRVKEPSPIEIDKPLPHTPETLHTLLEWRVLGIRNLTEMGLWRVQATIGDAIRGYLQSLDFVEFHSPKLLAEATEGGAEVFKLPYFGRQATLAQSAQFYKQIMVGSLERVFEFGATYRAEQSVTARHMTEFTTVDVEMGFIERFQEILELIENLICHTVETVWQQRHRELSTLGAIRPRLTEKFPQVPLRELHELCFRETGEDFRGEKDPSPFEERWICEYARGNWGCEAVFITEFPSSAMKFYHFRSETKPEVAERADLIFQGVEIITTSRREHRYDRLMEQLRAIGADPEHPGYRYYLQAFRYGMPSHAGFGLGLERLTQKIVGFANVKEATLFPRDPSRLGP